LQPLTVNFLKLEHSVGTPTYATEGSSGFDLPAAIQIPITLKSGEWVQIPTGLVFEIPASFEGQIRARSGLAHKYGITVLNGIGTIDSDYREEVKVLLINHGQSDFEVGPGQRIAQLVIAPVNKATLVEILNTSLSDSSRNGGFGSSGL
jgi:dUTP pyrophosphatase